MTTVMRMVEVSIIWMLMPSAASTRNMVAAMPGFERMPSPTSVTLPIWSSDSVSRCGRRSPMTSITSSALRRSGSGTVNERSARPSTPTFWMMVSTLMSASASAVNTVAATPG